jgi:hypothetical protein
MRSSPGASLMPPRKANAILSERELIGAMFDVGYSPLNTPSYPAGMESRMRKAISLAALLIMIASNSFAQSQMARTVDITTACQNEDDFSLYATLLKDDVTAAIMFRNDHSCTVFSAHTLVRIDHGVLMPETTHVCIRPVGPFVCYWTFAAHVELVPP